MSQIQRAVFFQLCGIFLLAGAVVALAHWFPLTSYLLQAQQRIGAMQVWGAVLYPLLFAACNVLLLPGGVIAMGSGLFFGLWWGFLLNLTGNLCGAAVAFFISRRLGRGWVERRFRHGRWAALDAAIGRDGWKIIFLSQIHPLFPTSLLNYLYGITRIRFGTCMLWITLGQAPGLFLYTYLGTLLQLGLRVLEGKSKPHPLEYVIWIGGLVLAVATTAALARIAFRLLGEMQAAGSEKPAPRDAEPELETTIP